MLPLSLHSTPVSFVQQPKKDLDSIGTPSFLQDIEGARRRTRMFSGSRWSGLVRNDDGFVVRMGFGLAGKIPNFFTECVFRYGFVAAIAQLKRRFQLSFAHKNQYSHASAACTCCCFLVAVPPCPLLYFLVSPAPSCTRRRSYDTVA